MTLTSALPQARALIAALLAILAIGFTAPMAGAQSVDDNLTWGIAPANNDHGEGRPNFAYTAQPGEQIADGIILTNQGTSELTLAITTADGYTTSDGRLDLYPGDVPVQALGAWVVPEVEEVNIAPGQSTQVDFHVNVPTDAAPGDHTGGILSVHSASDGANLQFDRRMALRIHVRIPGDSEVELQASNVRLEQPPSLNPFAPTGLAVTYDVTNTGDLRTYYLETLAVSGPFGLAASSAQHTAEEILPGSTITRTATLDGVWALGLTNVDLTVAPHATSGEIGQARSLSNSVVAIPWGGAVALLLLSALSVLLGVRSARRSKDATASSEAA